MEPITLLPGAVSCSWVCNIADAPGTCTVVIDNSVGLPVELMEFEVVEEKSNSVNTVFVQTRTERKKNTQPKDGIHTSGAYG